MERLQFSSESNIINNKDTKNKAIIIYICSPDHSIKTIKVVPTSKNETLQKLYQNKMLFVFNGQILSENLTFDFYTIKNNDNLIALHKSEDKKMSYNLFHWLNESKNDSFKENIQMIARKESKTEVARLFDLSLYRMEGHRKIFMKHMIRNINNVGDNIKSDNINLITDYEIPDEPSFESLPVPWGDVNKQLIC